MRCSRIPHPPVPEVHLLSNGRYHVVISSAGRRLQPLARSGGHPLARGCHRDGWGNVCLSARSGDRRILVHRHQPTCAHQRLRSHLHPGARRVSATHAGLEVHTEISVSPEDDVELRRITITNRSPWRASSKLTSYAEVVLAPPAADAAHPAFSNLFVQTEFARGPPPCSAPAGPVLRGRNRRGCCI
jgi:cyclic beta-1,2-glucan synthetase